MANEQAEFARNYECCFFRVPLKISKQYRAFMLTHMERDNTGTLMYFGKTITRSLQEKSASFPVEEFLKCPEPIIGTAGFVNCMLGTRYSSLYLELSPDRQYRKALCYEGHANSVWMLSTASPEVAAWLNSKRYDPKTGDHVATSETVLMRAVAHQLAFDGGPVYRGFRAAVEAINDGSAHSLAISRQFAVSLHRDYKHPLLWHKKSREGFIINGVVYGTKKLLPFKDFFSKRFGVEVRSITEAPKT